MKINIDYETNNKKKGMAKTNDLKFETFNANVFYKFVPNDGIDWIFLIKETRVCGHWEIYDLVIYLFLCTFISLNEIS